MEVVKNIINSGKINPKGSNLLLIASKNDSTALDTFKLLIDEGADVNHTDP